MKKLGVWTLGVFLILLGIVGLFLPILQGWLFIFLGLSLIAPRFARRLRNRLFRKFFKSDIVYFDEWKKAGIRAGFTTKRFKAVFHRTDDLLDKENQRIFISLLDKPEPKSVPYSKFALLGQVHGSGIAVLDDAARYGKEGFYHFPATDGALTNLSGMTLLVFSADCLPIYFACGDWVGLAHAGWRGTRDRIAGQMVRLLRERSGLHPREIRAAFGPCISAGHYEVGKDFRDFFRPSSFSEKAGKLYFDLAKENETQLVRAGVKRRYILSRDICTVSENESFYSFRKEGDKVGRTLSFITRG